MSIHDDLQQIQFQNELSPHDLEARDKLDFNEEGVYCRFEAHIFDTSDTHLQGIFDYERLKRNNIENISEDLYSLFPTFWEDDGKEEVVEASIGPVIIEKKVEPRVVEKRKAAPPTGY